MSGAVSDGGQNKRGDGDGCERGGRDDEIAGPGSHDQCEPPAGPEPPVGREQFCFELGQDAHTFPFSGALAAGSARG